jgi:signal transduction histidine kinase
MLKHKIKNETSNNYKLILSSLVAWATAMYVDVYQINHGANILLLGYVANLLIWVFALSVSAHYKKPLIVLCLIGVISTLLLAVSPQTLLTPVLLIFWMSYLPRLIAEKRVWMIYVVVNAALIGFLIFSHAESRVVITTISFAAFQLFAISSALQTIELYKQKDLIEKTNIDLIATQSLLLQKSKIEERQSISRNLHDSIGHQLTALSLQTEHALQLIKRDSEIDLQDYVSNMKRDIKETLNTLRKIVRQSNDANNLDLEATVQLIASKIPSVKFSFSSTTTITNSTLVEDLIYCFQEGISNAIRHGGANHIEIAVITQNSQVVITLMDNGHRVASPEISTPHSGNGLKGLANRLSSYNAITALTRNGTIGSTLTITLPSGQCLDPSYLHIQDEQ